MKKRWAWWTLNWLLNLVIGASVAIVFLRLGYRSGVEDAESRLR